MGNDHESRGADQGCVSPYAGRGPYGPLWFGLYPGCGFHLFRNPSRPLAEGDILRAIGLTEQPPLGAIGSIVVGVVSITTLGTWINVADDYHLWNDRKKRKIAIGSLAALGDLFTFQLPDPDMSYAFAFYRNGVRVRLRVVKSPKYWDQTLKTDDGPALPGEPEDWRGEPFPMMVSIARAIGVPIDIEARQRFYAWPKSR